MEAMKMRVAGACCLAVLVVATPGLAQPVEFGGPGSTIGVSVAELKSDQAAKTKQDAGVVVERVHEGTPAARAGFKEGDIVVEFDGEAVRSTRQFVRVVQETPPNRSVRAIVVRDGSRQTLNVTPELGRVGVDPSGEIRALANRNFRFAFPQSIDRSKLPDGFNTVPGTAWFARPVRLGIAIGAVGDQLAGYFGVKQGVLVESVEADSAASRAGLRAGDVITEVNGRAVAEPAELTSAIRTAQPGASIDVKVMREKKELTLKATLPDAERQKPRVAQPLFRRQSI